MVSRGTMMLRGRKLALVLLVLHVVIFLSSVEEKAAVAIVVAAMVSTSLSSDDANLTTTNETDRNVPSHLTQENDDGDDDDDRKDRDNDTKESGLGLSDSESEIPIVLDDVNVKDVNRHDEQNDNDEEEAVVVVVETHAFFNTESWRHRPKMNGPRNVVPYPPTSAPAPVPNNRDGSNTDGSNYNDNGNNNSGVASPMPTVLIRKFTKSQIPMIPLDDDDDDDRVDDDENGDGHSDRRQKQQQQQEQMDKLSADEIQRDIEEVVGQALELRIPKPLRLNGENGSGNSDRYKKPSSSLLSAFVRHQQYDDDGRHQQRLAIVCGEDSSCVNIDKTPSLKEFYYQQQQQQNDEEREESDASSSSYFYHPDLFSGTVLHVFQHDRPNDDVEEGGGGENDNVSNKRIAFPEEEEIRVSLSDLSNLPKVLSSTSVDTATATTGIQELQYDNFVFDKAYQLLEPLHLELGTVPKHYLDFAYTPVIDQYNREESFSEDIEEEEDRVPSPPGASEGDDTLEEDCQLVVTSKTQKNERRQKNDLKKQKHQQGDGGGGGNRNQHQMLVYERECNSGSSRGNSKAVISEPEKFSSFNFFSAWWKWWLPFTGRWWRDHGRSKSDYEMGKNAFAGGSHGEVWRGRRICNKRSNSNGRKRQPVFASGGQYRHTLLPAPCDDQQPLVLKRLRVARGYRLLEAGLREVYFGNLIQKQTTTKTTSTGTTMDDEHIYANLFEDDDVDENDSDGNGDETQIAQTTLFTTYVDHFFREVPRAFTNRRFSSSSSGASTTDLELWIVFEDAGPSLRDYLYTPVTTPAGFVMYQHSALWTQFRMSSMDKSTSIIEDDEEDMSIVLSTKTSENDSTQRQEEGWEDGFENESNENEGEETTTSGRQLKNVGRDVLRSILHQIITAAAALHERGIIHRDIKPSNVMCQSDIQLDNLELILSHLPTIHCVLGDFSSAWDEYTDENLYTKGPSPGEQTDEYAPPESYLGPNWIAFHEGKPQSYDSWSIGVLALEVLLGTPNVFSVDQRTTVLLTSKMQKKGATEEEIQHALYLAALSHFCIYLPAQNSTKKESWPLRYGDPLHKTTMVRKSCTLDDFHRALRARDPLGVGFDSSSDLLLHLIWQLLAWDPLERITASEALQHPYFTNPEGGITVQSLELAKLAAQQRQDQQQQQQQQQNLDPLDDQHHDHILDFDHHHHHHHQDVDTRSTLRQDSDRSSSSSSSSDTSINSDDEEALETRRIDPRIDFSSNDTVEEFVCPKCGRTFTDWNSCLRHAKSRRHAKFCTYDRSQLPTCVNTHSMLPAHPTSGYCDLQGRRRTIEDFHSIHLNPSIQFYGIFDGHTGNLASKYAASTLYEELLRQLPSLDDTAVRAISEGEESVAADTMAQRNSKTKMNNSNDIQNNKNNQNKNEKNMKKNKDGRPVMEDWKIDVERNVSHAFEEIHKGFLEAVFPPSSSSSSSSSSEKQPQRRRRRTPSYMDQSGTTATALLVTDNVIVVSSIGDSRAVLSSIQMPKNQQASSRSSEPIISAIPLTKDHVASDPYEQQLVIERGGWISTSSGDGKQINRVNGTLAITRSIGDANLASVLSRQPHVITMTRNEIRTLCGRTTTTAETGQNDGRRRRHREQEDEKLDNGSYDKNNDDDGNDKKEKEKEDNIQQRNNQIEKDGIKNKTRNKDKDNNIVKDKQKKEKTPTKRHEWWTFPRKRKGSDSSNDNDKNDNKDNERRRTGEDDNDATISKTDLSSSTTTSTTNITTTTSEKGNDIQEAATTTTMTMTKNNVDENNNDNDIPCFVVLASDGLWDVMSNEEAIEMVVQVISNSSNKNVNKNKNNNNSNTYNNKSSLSSPQEQEQQQQQQQNTNNMYMDTNYYDGDVFQEAAEILAVDAFVRGSTDNIGVCVVAID